MLHRWLTRLHRRRSTQHRKAGEEDGARERGYGAEMSFSHLWLWPEGMRAGVKYVVQHQITKADESTALAHMAILFRVQIVQ